MLALEKYRNLIETSIGADITLYTDHKLGLFENSLSNKGQLSAWRLLETADLLSIVENLYRTGGKMLLADPLSRICAPSDGFYDVELPAKIHALLQHLCRSFPKSPEGPQGTRRMMIALQAKWMA